MSGGWFPAGYMGELGVSVSSLCMGAEAHVAVSCAGELPPAFSAGGVWFERRVTGV